MGVVHSDGVFPIISGDFIPRGNKVCGVVRGCLSAGDSAQTGKRFGDREARVVRWCLCARERQLSFFFVVVVVVWEGAGAAALSAPALSLSLSQRENKATGGVPVLIRAVRLDNVLGYDWSLLGGQTIPCTKQINPFRCTNNKWQNTATVDTLQ